MKEDIHEYSRIELSRKIAAGGMGTVYEAWQYGADGFKKAVALKLIREEYSEVQNFRANFFGEAQLVADLIHTNIVQTYHLGDANGRLYITMELVRGTTLSEFINLHQSLNRSIPVDLAVFIASRICRGLAYAHRYTDLQGRPLNIVHRDVNPRNVMLSYEGDVKLTDFGIAKARNLMYNTEGKIIPGRYEYIAPEQARKEVTDLRADIFSLGIVLAEMLHGENIFLGYDEEQSIDNILNLPIPCFFEEWERVDAPLSSILNHCLQRKREERYQNADDLQTDLEQYIYKDGYGPTNDKLSTYMRSLFEDAGYFKDNEQLRYFFHPTTTHS